MPQSEARAWWDDVQHVRETIERRRAEAARSDAARDRRPAGRFVRSTDARAERCRTPPLPADV